MKRIIIFVLLLSSVLVACNKTDDSITIIQKSVSLDEAGTLSSLLTEDEMLTVTELSISGPLNGSDIRVLRNMAKNCSLSTLNLRDASIVAGGHPYLVESDGTMYYTAEDELSTRMFSSCIKLDSIILPRNLKTIGEEAFHNCKHLNSVVWFEGLDSIGEQAFFNAYFNHGEITLPKSLRVIGRRAFFETDITKVTIQSDIIVPSYENYYLMGGNSPFADCLFLKEVVVTEGCTKLAAGFQECYALSSVTLPSTLTHLGGSPSTYSFIFKSCSNLHSISLPNGLQFIGRECFYHSGLTEIEIPKTVQTIGEFAFADTPLETVKVKWDNPAAVNTNILAFTVTALDEASLYVPMGTLNLYKDHIIWGRFGNIIEE